MTYVLINISKVAEIADPPWPKKEFNSTVKDPCLEIFNSMSVSKKTGLIQLHIQFLIFLTFFCQLSLFSLTNHSDGTQTPIVHPWLTEWNITTQFLFSNTWWTQNNNPLHSTCIYTIHNQLQNNLKTLSSKNQGPHCAAERHYLLLWDEHANGDILEWEWVWYVETPI